ncbi:hypothetical protein BTHE68_71350 (plasmid) [Burkholderia sp. THE68]|uniref:hypothetical protein n=1 Tax=Burkholderia sp. THE68 TaxID=758782 RepID=UPI0013174ACE|nr:hypothetical protein [Burkholderia sp. THE68]BBU33401.1 hypothetical protein BTHE68_71350 [Burkholderia sp. THE68]
MLPDWLTALALQYKPWQPFIVGGVGAVVAVGGALKWLYDIRKARAEAKDRAEAAAKKQNLVKVPTLTELESALKEFDQYEKLRTEHLRRIARGRITNWGEQAEQYAREQMDLTPVAAVLIADSLLVGAVRDWEKAKHMGPQLGWGPLVLVFVFIVMVVGIPYLPLLPRHGVLIYPLILFGLCVWFALLLWYLISRLWYVPRHGAHGGSRSRHRRDENEHD